MNTCQWTTDNSSMHLLIVADADKSACYRCWYICGCRLIGSESKLSTLHIVPGSMYECLESFYTMGLFQKVCKFITFVRIFVFFAEAINRPMSFSVDHYYMYIHHTVHVYFLIKEVSTIRKTKNKSSCLAILLFLWTIFSIEMLCIRLLDLDLGQSSWIDLDLVDGAIAEDGSSISIMAKKHGAQIVQSIKAGDVKICFISCFFTIHVELGFS